ncbi:membrane protein implicated in regulation of membrane protease activity [Halarchaeum rubridurum]|uniref:Membrane protein implicated in regulation of membrane protease activity n=1 Tax=Halarchaeum rubridurum TaxID=489911 RepID=A0A8T4GL72_9EURY|nr:membrane protein implicated in regulation of membrane protease activity [Halarchaeum rubridurum]
MDLAAAIRSSTTYRVLRALGRWTANSTVYALCADERVLLGGLAAFVLVSVVSVLASSLGAAVKFLSFLLLAALVALVVQRRLDALAE